MRSGRFRTRRCQRRRAAGIVLFLTAALTFAGLAPVAAAQSAEEQTLAKRLLHGLQAASIRSSREYCGLIGRRSDGQLVAIPARRGTRARCRFPDHDPDLRIVASYHTHGAFLRQYDNEVPSVMDLMMDIQFGTTGYVSTPGGRLWLIDSARREVRLICGLRCLPWDPRYDGRSTGLVARKYTLDELRARQR